jgi:hypothetical protein
LSGGKLGHVECSFYHFWGVLKLVAIAQNFRTPEKWFKEHSTWGNFQNPLFAFLRLEYLDIFGGILKNSKSENFLLYINGVVCKVENPENPLFFKKKRRVEALNSILKPPFF